MSGRTWIPVVSTQLSHPTKRLSISRGFSADVKASNSRFSSLFSLQVLLEYQNGYQATIPLLSEVVTALRNFVDGNLEIPSHGLYIESEARHFVILENKGKEVTISFERNKYRNTVRLSTEELDSVFRFHRIKQYLYDVTKVKTSIFDRHGSKTGNQNMSLYIQVWTALGMKTRHELGTCDCYDVIEGMPCNMSVKRCTADRIKELMGGVQLYGEVLSNIVRFRELLGMQIPFDGFHDDFISTCIDPDLTSDCCLFVKTVLKQ